MSDVSRSTISLHNQKQEENYTSSDNLAKLGRKSQCMRIVEHPSNSLLCCYIREKSCLSPSCMRKAGQHNTTEIERQTPRQFQEKRDEVSGQQLTVMFSRDDDVLLS